MNSQWDIGKHNVLQKETTCGCFSTVVASRKEKLVNDKCLESFFGRGVQVNISKLNITNNKLCS